MTDSTPHTLHEDLLEVHSTSLHTSFLSTQSPRADKLTVIIMHGAGESDSSRHAGLARLFADNGVSVVALDFVGHGITGGHLGDSSLSLRTEHAQAAIERWTDANTPLILCGFSMSGHVVLRLLPRLGARVKSIGLFCPATYAVEAEDVMFGDEFTEILHQPDSWRSSLGLQHAAQFKGRAAIIVGSEDAVIPWEVTAELVRRLKANASEVRLEVLGGVNHQLAAWLSNHKEFSEQIVRYLAGELL